MATPVMPTSELINHFVTTDKVTIGDKTLLVPKTLVAERPDALGYPNIMEEKRLFVQQQRNALFECRPSVVHFGGFLLGHDHQQTVKILNISGASHRIHVLQPQTPFFKFRASKKGVVPPGLSEEILIEFSPTEWRYYYDCIRIHTEDENLLVPIHAYPVVNEVDFPKALDLGTVPINDSVSRTLSFSCKVPIEFEFSITVLDDNPDLEIYPLRGTVPANGQVDVVIRYCPSRMITLRVRAVLEMSQFGWKPLTCVITANAAPGANSSKTYATMRQMTERQSESISPGKVDIFSPHSSASSSRNKTKRMTANQFHTAVEKQSAPEPDYQLFGRGTFEGEQRPEETIVDGIRVPDNATTHSATVYMLLQEPGKMKAMDLKNLLNGETETQGGTTHRSDKTIAQNLDPKAKANLALKTFQSRSRMFQDVEEAWGANLSLQRLEIALEKELRANMEYERAKEVRWFVAIGENPLEQEEIEDVLERRVRRKEYKARLQRQSDRDSLEVQVVPGRVAHGMMNDPGHVPTYDPYLNDAWRIRKEVLLRFVEQVRKYIVRNRVAKRLEGLEQLLSVNKQELDRLLAEVASGAGPSGPPPSRLGSSTGDTSSTPMVGYKSSHDPMTVERIATTSFPAYLDSNFQDRKPVDVGQLPELEDWDLCDLRVPQEYKLLGHAPRFLPAVPQYISRETDRKVRTGAEEESGVRGPRGPTDTGSEDAPGPPMVCAHPPKPPPAPVPALAPILPGKLFAFVPSVWIQETDIHYPLRPHPRWPPEAPDKAIGYAAETAAKACGPRASVSCLWRPLREQSDCIMRPLPRLLSGPLAEDAQSDDDEEGAPPVVPVPPTLDDVRAEFDVPAATSDVSATGRSAKEALLEETEREARASLARRLPSRLEELNTLIDDPRLKLALA
mmetsp:Transcript_21541/g.50695  ORF Transcript_21541/g.50695 Transcript_21541/m.50695 type:complete len:904 (+) Transcript_21541:118-2829(+)